MSASLIFNLRGVSLTPYYSQDASTYAFRGAKLSTLATVAAPPAGATNVFGNKVIDYMIDGGGQRGLGYVGNMNWTNATNGAFAALFRIVPGWAGAPSFRESLIQIGDSSFRCSLNMYITTSAQLFVELCDPYTNDLINFTTTGTFTFATFVTTDIMVSWNGTTTAGSVLVSQDGASIYSGNANNQITSFNPLLTPGIYLSADYDDPSTAARADYFLNEIAIWNGAMGTSYALRTTFTTTAPFPFNHDNNTDPGIGNVLSGTDYVIQGTTLVGTLAQSSGSSTTLLSAIFTKNPGRYTLPDGTSQLLITVQAQDAKFYTLQVDYSSGILQLLKS